MESHGKNLSISYEMIRGKCEIYVITNYKTRINIGNLENVSDPYSYISAPRWIRLFTKKSKSKKNQTK